MLPNPLGPWGSSWDLGPDPLHLKSEEALARAPMAGRSPGNPPYPPRAFVEASVLESGAQPRLNLTST